MTSELLLREEEIHRLEEARADSERRGDELEAAYERQQGRVVLLVEEVGVMRGRLADDARTITAIRLEMDEQAGAAIAAEREAVDLRNRLSVTESALAQRSHEAEETSAELTAVRRELQETARLRTEAGKIVHGLKEHVDLLIVDAKERSAAAIGAHGELGQAREQAAKAVAEANLAATGTRRGKGCRRRHQVGDGKRCECGAFAPGDADEGNAPGAGEGDGQDCNGAAGRTRLAPGAGAYPGPPPDGSAPTVGSL